MAAIVKLIIDSVSATCPACGHAQFRPPTLRELARRALTCGHCGAKVAYGALLQQIVRERSGPPKRKD